MTTSDHEHQPPTAATDHTACRQCHLSHRCGEAWSQPARGPLSQGGISLGSTAAFLVPIISGILGMALAGRGTQTHILLYQTAGFALGLAAGVLPAWLLFKLIRARLLRMKTASSSTERNALWPRPDELL